MIRADKINKNIVIKCIFFCRKNIYEEPNRLFREKIKKTAKYF